MKRLIALILFLSGSIVLNGQKIDSLTSLMKSHIDSVRIDAAIELGSYYIRRDPDSARFFLKSVQEVAENSGNTGRLLKIQNLLGNVYLLQSSYDSASFYYGKGIREAYQVGDTIKAAALINNTGLIYTYKAEYDTAIQIFLKAREIREKLGDPKISSTVNNLGMVYGRMDKFDKALEYYQEAETLKEKFNQRQSLSNTLNNIGIILRKQGRLEEAIGYYKKSLTLAEEFKDLQKQANAHNNLANIYGENPTKSTLAKWHYETSIRLKKQIGDKVALLNSYNNYASFLTDRELFIEALTYLELAEKLNEELGHTIYSSHFHISRARAYYGMGEYQKAYNEFKTAYNIKLDELENELNEKIAAKEVAFETAKKEAEITRLELMSTLQKSELEKARQLQFFLIVAFVMTVLAGVVFYILRSKKVKAEKEASQLQIEALHKRLMDLNASPTSMHLTLNELNLQLHSELTEREYEVLTLSMEGKTNQEIADNLSVSSSTVKFHLRNVYSKLGVTNRKEAVQYVSKA